MSGHCQESLSWSQLLENDLTLIYQEMFKFLIWMLILAATHCHDLRYLFGKGLYAKFRPNMDDMHMLDITATFFINYAKYGLAR